MLSSKQGPIFPKRIYKPKRAFGKYFEFEGLVSLLVMIIIRYKSEMGFEKYAWRKEGRLCYPASIDIPRHSIQEQESMSYFITTRYQSTTVINYTHMQCSDVNLFWKIQYPTKNDIIYDTFEWHCSSATTKKRLLCYLAIQSAGTAEDGKQRPGALEEADIDPGDSPSGPRNKGFRLGKGYRIGPGEL